MVTEASTRHKGNVLKVIELGLEKRIYEEIKKPKFSVEALARQLKKEGTPITSQSIRKFLKKTKKAQRELIASDIKAAHEFRKLTMDYSKEIKSILDEVKDVKDVARKEGDLGSYNQMVGRLMQGLELIAKLTGDMAPKETKVDINIIYKKIDETINHEMKRIKNNIINIDAIDIDEDIKDDDEKNIIKNNSYD